MQNYKKSGTISLIEAIYGSIFIKNGAKIP